MYTIASKRKPCSNHARAHIKVCSLNIVNSTNMQLQTRNYKHPATCIHTKKEPNIHKSPDIIEVALKAWNVVIKLDGKCSSSKYVDRLTGIDPNDLTISYRNNYHLLRIPPSIFKSTHFVCFSVRFCERRESPGMAKSIKNTSLLCLRTKVTSGWLWWRETSEKS